MKVLLVVLVLKLQRYLVIFIPAEHHLELCPGVGRHLPAPASCFAVSNELAQSLAQKKRFQPATNSGTNEGYWHKLDRMGRGSMARRRAHGPTLGSLLVVATLIPSRRHPPVAGDAGELPAPVEGWHGAPVRRGRPAAATRGCRAASPSPLTQMGLREAPVVLLESVSVPAARGAGRGEGAARALAVAPGADDLPLALSAVGTLAPVKGSTSAAGSRRCRYRGEAGDCHREAYYGKERKSALWCRKHRQVCHTSPHHVCWASRGGALTPDRAHAGRRYRRPKQALCTRGMRPLCHLRVVRPCVAQASHGPDRRC